MTKPISYARTELLLLAVFVCLGPAGLAAPPEAPAVSEQPINEFCPVMTEERADPSITTTYQGQIIAFCCQRCRRKFEANPERYAAPLTAFRKGAGGSMPGAGREGQAQPDEGESQEHQHGSSRIREGVATASREARAHRDGGPGQAGGDEREPMHADHEHDESESHADHEHEEHATPASGVARLIAWIGGFHPASVNFPIAMLVGAAVAELLWIGTKRQLFAHAGRFCLWFGGVGAVVAGTLGWFFAGFHLTDDTWIMTTHRWLGTATASWALLTLIVGERAYRAGKDTRRGAYRVLLFVGAIAVLVTGFFGGAMLYGIDHYAW